MLIFSFNARAPKDVCNFSVAQKMRKLWVFEFSKKRLNFPAKQASMHTFDILGNLAKLWTFKTLYF